MPVRIMQSFRMDRTARPGVARLNLQNARRHSRPGGSMAGHWLRNLTLTSKYGVDMTIDEPAAPGKAPGLLRRLYPRDDILRLGDLLINLSALSALASHLRTTLCYPRDHHDYREGLLRSVWCIPSRRAPVLTEGFSLAQTMTQPQVRECIRSWWAMISTLNPIKMTWRCIKTSNLLLHAALALGSGLSAAPAKCSAQRSMHRHPAPGKSCYDWLDCPMRFK